MYPAHTQNDLSPKQLLLKYCTRIPWLIIYYILARWLPCSDAPVLGRPSRKFRSFICRHIFDYCGTNVNIDRNVLFGSGFRIRIGNNSGMGRNSVITSDIEIGENVMMGPHCHILTRNHNTVNIELPMCQQGFCERKKTTIGNNIWIGREVLFTPGRTIKDGCIIAARTCLCKDFPEYSVIGGNPARLIKLRK